MWLPQLIYYMFKYFAKKAFSRFVVTGLFEAYVSHHITQLVFYSIICEFQFYILLYFNRLSRFYVIWQIFFFFIFIWLLPYFITICTTVFMPKLNKLIISWGLYQKLSGSARIHFQGQQVNLGNFINPRSLK